MHAVRSICAAALALSAASAQALTIEFDYSLDTINFFTADKRAVLDQVASIFENNLGNHLAALSNVNVNTSGMSYYDSQTGQNVTLPGTAITAPRQNIAADTLRFFVAAADLPSATLGLSYVGTSLANRVNTANNNFGSGWGGEIVFDTTMDMSMFGSGYAGQTAARRWYVDSDIRSTEAVPTNYLPTTPGGSLSNGYYVLKDQDFASVVMHEMGHAFGLQHSSNPNDAMYAVTDGERNFFDPNDWAAMGARGWQVLSTSPNLYTTVTMPSVPEPAAPALLLAGLAVVGVVARRR